MPAEDVMPSHPARPIVFEYHPDVEPQRLRCRAKMRGGHTGYGVSFTAALLDLEGIVKHELEACVAARDRLRTEPRRSHR